LAKNEGEAARAAVAEEKATEVAKNQIVAKSKMSKAEKEKAKKDKAKVRHGDGKQACSCSAHATLG
jgi:hypothetical protein